MKVRGWRNFFRFRLRTLLLAFTAVSVWLGFHVHSTRMQRQSAASIEQYGGWIRYDFQFPSGEYSYKNFDPKARSPAPEWLLDRLGVDFFHDVVQANLNYSEDSGKREENHNPSDDALQYLRGFPDLRVLLLSDTQASDSSMQYLAGLNKLEYLFMWDVTNVSDAGVAHLRGLKRLRYIHLSSSQITDKSLADFASLPEIEGLSLQFNHLTDEGLEDVARLEQLTTLWVCGESERKNRITDAGLKRLENLKMLTQLGIQNTEVTPHGIEEFLQAVPGCKISQ
jgi:internalin A